MADAKITALTTLSSPATGDLIPIVDIDDSTDSANGTTKKITAANLALGVGGVRFETPTGSINGSNVTFTVVNTPRFVVLNGSIYFENDGYTLSGLTITMLITPDTGSVLRSAY